MLPKTVASLIPLFALFLAGTFACGQEFTAKVVGIDDGDSIKLLTGDKTEIRVRLLGIDAPEWKQPYRDAAKQSLSDLIFGKTVRVQPTGEDRYHRVTANVFIDRVWVNYVQVRRGLAWHYVRYSTDKGLAAAELTARTERLGLWQEPQPTPPWEWRAVGRKQR